MARTYNGVKLQPSAAVERPEPIPLMLPGFTADLGLIEATQLDADSVILLPDTYIHDPDDSLEASWRETNVAGRCWKATLIYEQLNQNHPRLVPFLRRDPWTATPVLAKPSGPPLEKFIAQHKARMYSAQSGRIVPSYRPLIYQWALHLISGLAFIHANDIIFGDLNLSHCWLSSDLSLSIVGFVDAGFRCEAHWGRVYDGDCTSGDSFHPLNYQPKPTKQSDLFLYACIVYELMAGTWPGNLEQDVASIPHRQWPALETECMGEIVRQCWNGEYNSAEEIKVALVVFLDRLGWEIEGDDNLKGFDATHLFTQ